MNLVYKTERTFFHFQNSENCGEIPILEQIKDSKITLLPVQTRALLYYIRNFRCEQFHLGQNLHISENFETGKIIFQNFEFDISRECLMPISKKFIVRRDDLVACFTHLEPYIPETTPCFLTHRNDKEISEQCPVCNPDYLIKSLYGIF